MLCNVCFYAVGWAAGSAPACKNWVMRCWCGYLSVSRCRLFAYYPADATLSQNPVISCLIFISRLVLPFWYWITQVVLEKRLWNGCRVVVCVCTASESALVDRTVLEMELKGVCDVVVRPMATCTVAACSPSDAVLCMCSQWVGAGW